MKCSNRELVYVGNVHKRNTKHLTHIINIHNCLSLSCPLYNLQCICIQAVLSVILTFVPRQNVLKLNNHSNVHKSPPINIHFFIAGQENRYFVGKSERPWAHELTSQTGGELMSWSLSVSAALQSPIYTGSVERYTDLCTALKKAICKYRYTCILLCKHILQWNNHVNVSNSPSVSISFLIGGLNNE